MMINIWHNNTQYPKKGKVCVFEINWGGETIIQIEQYNGGLLTDVIRWAYKNDYTSNYIKIERKIQKENESLKIENHRKLEALNLCKKIFDDVDLAEANEDPIEDWIDFDELYAAKELVEKAIANNLELKFLSPDLSKAKDDKIENLKLKIKNLQKILSIIIYDKNKENSHLKSELVNCKKALEFYAERKHLVVTGHWAEIDWDNITSLGLGSDTTGGEHKIEIETGVVAYQALKKVGAK